MGTPPVPSPTNGHTASHIAQSFVAVYYRLAASAPTRLAELYGPASTVDHGPDHLATGISSIARLSPNLPLAQSQNHPTVASLTVQPTASDGYLVCVLGTFEKPNVQHPTLFSQTFVLEKQTDSHKDHFYCRNDIFIDVSAAPVPAPLPPLDAVKPIPSDSLPNNNPKPTTKPPPTNTAPLDTLPVPPPHPLPPQAAKTPPPQPRAPEPQPQLPSVQPTPKPHLPPIQIQSKTHPAPPSAPAPVSPDPTDIKVTATPVLPEKPSEQDQDPSTPSTDKSSTRPISRQPNKPKTVQAPSSPPPEPKSPASPNSPMPNGDAHQQVSPQPNRPSPTPVKKTWASIVSSKEAAAAAAEAAQNDPASQTSPSGLAKPAERPISPPKHTADDLLSAQPAPIEQVENIPPSVDADGPKGTGTANPPPGNNPIQNGHRPNHVGGRNNHQRVFGPSAVVQLAPLSPTLLQDPKTLSGNLREEFGQYGFKLRHVEVKAQKGIAFIEYETSEGVRAAVAAWASGPRQQGTFAGIPLNVTEKRPYGKWRPGSMRGGGRGGPRGGRRNRPTSTPMS